MTQQGILKLKEFFKTNQMKAIAQSVKRDGMRKTLSRFGWKILVFTFFGYLIRDVVIYILIPYWATRGLIK